MNSIAGKTIVASFGTVAVIAACYITKSAIPLWGFILVAIVTDGIAEKKSK